MSGRIGMLVHHYFPRDVRVRREARALAAAGYQVTVVCLRQPGQQKREQWRGIEILRQPVRRHRGSPLAVYLAEYLAMTAWSLAAISRLHLTEGFDAIHVHTPPDFLAAAGLAGRLSGAKLVVDVHDLSPELFSNRFGGRGGRLAAGLLQAAEQAACLAADRVITVTEVFRRKLAERGCAASKIHVLHNCPDEEIFSPREDPPRAEGAGFRVVHHGTLMRRYGLDVLLEAFAQVAVALPHAKLDVFGEGDLEAELRRRADQPDLVGRVQLHGDVSQDRLADELAGADLCVVPNRSDPFTDLLLPTKLLEALRMGRPAIASATPVIDQAFDDDEVYKVPPDDPQALAAAMVALATDDRARAALAKKGHQAADRYLWSEEKKKLLSLYEGLIGAF